MSSHYGFGSYVFSLLKFVIIQSSRQRKSQAQKGKRKKDNIHGNNQKSLQVEIQRYYSEYKILCYRSIQELSTS